MADRPSKMVASGALALQFWGSLARAWRDGRRPVPFSGKKADDTSRVSANLFPMANQSLWQRFQSYYLRYDDLGFSLDISRMRFPDGFLEKMAPQVAKAFAAMRDLEAGGIANPDENRDTTSKGSCAPATFERLAEGAFHARLASSSGLAVVLFSAPTLCKARSASRIETCFSYGARCACEAMRCGVSTTHSTPSAANCRRTGTDFSIEREPSSTPGRRCEWMSIMTLGHTTVVVEPSLALDLID